MVLPMTQRGTEARVVELLILTQLQEAQGYSLLTPREGTEVLVVQGQEIGTGLTMVVEAVEEQEQ